MTHLLWLAMVAGAAALGVYLGGWASEKSFGRHTGPEARRQWGRRLADASFDGLLVHRNGTILQMNRALVRLLGYREVELLGSHFSNLAPPAQQAALRMELEAPQPHSVEFTLVHADKSERFVELASHMLEFDGLPATVTAIRDKTAVKALEARLAYLMHNDTLTGLANAAMFTEKLQQAVARNDASGGTTAVLTLQLEQLKAVNAQLGRRGGDLLLRQVANRLTQLKHDEDAVARLSGDRFAILQPHTGAPHRTALLTSQIETAMKEPFIVEGKAICVSFAIGIAIYPEHASSAETLLNASGFALSKAMETGGTHTFSHAEAAADGYMSLGSPREAAPGSRMLNLAEQRLAHDLRLGIPRGEISLEYQPVFNARHLGIAGYETVARWWHPKEGLVPAEKFISLADDAGLAAMLGNFILETACAEAVRCKAPMMAIPLSTAQFRDPLLPARLRDALRKTGLPPDRLEVQIAEAVLEETPEAAQRLRAIRDVGVMLTLCDLHAAAAAFGNLAEVRFDRLKIGNRYLDNLAAESAAQAKLTAISALARKLDMELAADGVENEAQLAFLQEKGCAFVSGPLLGKPAPQPAAAAQPPKPSLVVG